MTNIFITNKYLKYLFVKFIYFIKKIEVYCYSLNCSSYILRNLRKLMTKCSKQSGNDDRYAISKISWLSFNNIEPIVNLYMASYVIMHVTESRKILISSPEQVRD